MFNEKLNSFKDVLIEKKSIAHVAFVRKNGIPHVSPVWFDMSLEDLQSGIINFNSAKGRVKTNNIAKGNQISLSILDPDNPYRYIGITGTINKIIEGKDAEDHIDKLAKKYIDKEKYPYRQPNEERVKYVLNIDKVYGG